MIRVKVHHLFFPLRLSFSHTARMRLHVCFAIAQRTRSRAKMPVNRSKHPVVLLPAWRKKLCMELRVVGPPSGGSLHSMTYSIEWAISATSLQTGFLAFALFQNAIDASSLTAVPHKYKHIPEATPSVLTVRKASDPRTTDHHSAPWKHITL